MARGNAVTKAVQILGELRFSLRRDVAPQYCDTMNGLYGYLQNRLIQAHAEKSESMLQEVSKLIQTLLDGWIGAMQNLNAQDAGASTTGASNHYSAPSGSPYSSHYSSSQYATTTTAVAPETRNRSWQF